MPGFSSLNIAISGMRSAQTGLAVTGHNMANAEIGGFSRQRSIQNDTRSRTIGVSAGNHRMMIGTGVDNQAVHHIRSKYFDIMYRQHNARLHFHSVIASAGEHIERILGETDTTYKLSDLLNDMRDAFHELGMDLSAIETREFFISTSIAFLDKAHIIFDSLFDFQQNLDAQIRNMVTEINDIVSQIHFLNGAIRGNELRAEGQLMGDNANDLRDERHRLMDRLSGLIPTQFFEHKNGDIDILTINGNFLLHQGSVNPLGLKFISGRYSFVEPVFTHSAEILDADTPPRFYLPLFDWRTPINAEYRNDEGALMGLLRARGAMPATYRGIDALWNPARPYTRPEVPAGWTPEGPNELWFGGPPDPTDAGAFPGGVEDPDFLVAWNLYLLEWAPYLNHVDYNGPRPPVPADFDIHYNDENTWPASWGGNWLGDPDAVGVPGDIVPWHQNPDFMGALHRYSMERENDAQQFQLLYPLSIISPADFNANRGPAPTPNMEIHRQLMDSYNAARRTYRQAAWSKEHALVPRIMMEMDQVVNSVIRLINNSLAPILNYERYENAPFDLHRTRSYTEVFVRRLPGDSNYMSRFDGDGIHNPGMPGAFNTLYTTRNLMINPALLLPGGYNLLAFHLDSDSEDTRLIQEMIRNWNATDGDYSITIGENTFSISDAYRIFVVELGMETEEAVTFMGTSFQQTSQADFRRNTIAGVSMDEEISSMMTFQFAYQAAARLFNIVDSMIDTVVNRMGRVGL